ncbi:OPT family oligopeptide transporter [Silvibacterium dinghuense]|uniref:Oligopeptide transporter, OPT family n=1 Tax=Silvibacterium dinghuense TaxID=1560006 RepID=A0A4Q1S9V0_9BACT|nr:oligopeptide transporter, OPT family [Silvibacterium dinghuense]RXS93711.1 oligopeptide transporter, OPT family [Silvibacterium dinghuense]
MSAQPDFQPFVPATETRREFTVRAVLLGAIFGILFGAVTVYVGLRAGLTVAASIPISVLSISVLRALGKASILENNIVQTTGNAGQSIAAGVIFTLPALIFLGFDLEYTRIFILALLGGWLGVLFMIPLRRQLIVEEHGNLTYPEGTACADVLIAGEKGGSFASRVFFGLGLGALYTLFQNENLLGAWPGTPNYEPKWLPGSAIRADATPEYLGVGYIIGPRVAGVLIAGGVFSWLVVMPMIHFFGVHVPGAVYPGTVPIAQMSPSDLWSTYVRPMGAGAVAASGLITLLKTTPTIFGALRGTLTAGAKTISKNVTAKRTEHDLPMGVVIGGSLLLVLLMFLFLTLKPVPGAQVGWLANLAASLLVVLFGFLFVTVSSRIVGLIGSSANPISGMTIATLMATAAIFLVKGWTAPAFGALAITIGGTVCIAAANAGDTSQDLKTGFLVGATPWKQQLAVMIGVGVSVFSIGLTLNAMNKGLETFKPMKAPIALSLSALPSGVQIQQQHFARPRIELTEPGKPNHFVDSSQYVLLNALGSPTLADGKYLYNPSSGNIEVQWSQGIGSEKAAAPQGRLMATVINGILSRKLPWGLVLLGVFLVIAVELLGIRSLSFAVGAYLSIGTTLAIFVGGIMRWMVDRAVAKAGGDASETESEVSPGSLYASGLIAAGGIMGLCGVCLKLYEAARGTEVHLWFAPGSGPYNILSHQPVSVAMFALLAFSLYYFARKPLK